MNATAHGIAHALAHGAATASHEISDVAKTREGKGRHHTTPQGISSWLSSHHVVQEVTRAGAHDAMMRTESRFQANHVATASGCWQWTGHTNQKGYGRLWNGERLVGAHRYSYERHVGPIPDGKEIGHLCHNPGCVNPEHLQAMTHAENLAMRYQREGAPCATLGRPMTAAERHKRHRDKKRREAEQARIESGWWVSI